MSDKIIEELWEIKDGLARESGYNIDVLISQLQDGRRDNGHQVCDLAARKRAAEPVAQRDAEDGAR